MEFLELKVSSSQSATEWNPNNSWKMSGVDWGGSMDQQLELWNCNQWSRVQSLLWPLAGFVIGSPEFTCLGCKWPTGLPGASWDSWPCGPRWKLLVYQLFRYPYKVIFFPSTLDAVCELVVLFRSGGVDSPNRLGWLWWRHDHGTKEGLKISRHSLKVTADKQSSLQERGKGLFLFPVFS